MTRVTMLDALWRVLPLGLLAPALGVGVALGVRSPRQRWWRGVSAAVALLAVATLGPEVWASLGPVALVAVVLGFGLPALVERWAVHRTPREPVPGCEHAPDCPHAERPGLDASFLVLLGHRFFDGLAAATLGPHVHARGALHIDPLPLLLLHGVPVMLPVLLGLRAQRGRLLALRRALWLGLAPVAGGLLLGVPAWAEALLSVQPWSAAVLLGVLGHGVVHPVGGHRHAHG